MKATMDMIRAVRGGANISTGRRFDDFFADRIVRAGTEPTLLAFVEHLAQGVNVSTGYIGGSVTAAFMREAMSPEAPRILAWIRRHPRIAALLAALKDPADYEAAINDIDIGPAQPEATGTAPPAPPHEIGIEVECLAPLAHGGDGKAGNATLFRRCQVLSTTGAILHLPIYAGNAVRGQVRDLMADHLVRALGLDARRDRPPLALWFFHVLYAGGVLEEGGSAKELSRELGQHGSVRASGVTRLRDMLPMVSLLGAALGDRVIAGRPQFGHLRPHCREWANGDVAAAELMEWQMLTRREDHEAHEAGEHHGMIATTEVLKAGTRLSGGVDISDHANSLERSALGRGLRLLQERGYLGAENRRGFGAVRIGLANAPDPAEYDAFLAERKADILAYIREIGGLHGGLDVAA